MAAYVCQRMALRIYGLRYDGLDYLYMHVDVPTMQTINVRDGRSCPLLVLTYAYIIYKPVHEISNNVVCATSKASDQPAHTRSLIRAFASRLSIL